MRGRIEEVTKGIKEEVREGGCGGRGRGGSAVRRTREVEGGEQQRGMAGFCA